MTTSGSTLSTSRIERKTDLTYNKMSNNPDFESQEYLDHLNGRVAWYEQELTRMQDPNAEPDMEAYGEVDQPPSREAYIETLEYMLEDWAIQRDELQAFRDNLQAQG